MHIQGVCVQETHAYCYYKNIGKEISAKWNLNNIMGFARSALMEYTDILIN